MKLKLPILGAIAMAAFAIGSANAQLSTSHNRQTSHAAALQGGRPPHGHWGGGGLLPRYEDKVR